MRIGSISLALTCCFLLAPALGAETLGASFSYQGNLEQSGSPANGVFDFRVVAFDSFEFGNQVGPVLVIEDQNVSNGLVNLDVDLGTDVFDGHRRWIQMEVREGSSTGGFTTLNPRQEIRPAPYALHSKNTEAIKQETIETGTIGNCETAGQTGTQGSVVFESRFVSLPRIFLAPDESADNNGCTTARLIARNLDGFSWQSYLGNGPFTCDCIHWIAFGQK